MTSFKMSWLLIIVFISFTSNNFSEANNEKQHPYAVIVGTVYCDTCFQEVFSKDSHFISGASVAIECGDGTSKPSFRQEAKTNEHGEFKVHLPISVSKHVNKIRACSVKLIKSSEPYCAVASTASSSSLHLKTKKQGTHIFSAGFFTFKPLNQPNLCNQKPSLQNSEELSSTESLLPPKTNPSFPSPIQDPKLPNSPPLSQKYLPPLPYLPMLPPLPQLPPLPSLPRLPGLPPLPGKTTNSKPTESSMASQSLNDKVPQQDFFFPIPLVPSPPPSIGIPLPPNPFQPPPTLPTNPFQPSPPFINLPPIPGITPSPPPPLFPFPLPPLPFPPSPVFPGIPPASSSSSSKKSSP